MLRAFKQGVWEIKASKSLVVLLWLTNLVLAVTVMFPLVTWLSTLDWTAETDALGDPFSLPLLFEVFRRDGPSVFVLLSNLLTWIAVLTVVVNVFLTAGILSALVETDLAARRERFWVGAARLFPRFLLLLLLGVIAALAILIPLNIGLGALNYRISERTDSELLGFLGGLIQVAVSASVVFFIVLCLQYARIQTVVDRGLAAWNAFLRGTVFVVRNLFATVGLGFCFGIIGVSLTVLYFSARQGLIGLNWGSIGLLVLIQQLVMLVRSGLRLGLAGAEIELFRQRGPVAQPAPVEEESSTNYTNDYTI